MFDPKNRLESMQAGRLSKIQQVLTLTLTSSLYHSLNTVRGKMQLTLCLFRLIFACCVASLCQNPLAWKEALLLAVQLCYQLKKVDLTSITVFPFFEVVTYQKLAN